MTTLGRSCDYQCVEASHEKRRAKEQGRFVASLHWGESPSLPSRFSRCTPTKWTPEEASAVIWQADSFSDIYWLLSCFKWSACGGAEVRVLVSHQWGSGSTLVLYHMLVEFAVCSRLARRVFLRVLRFSSLHKNQHFQIPTSKCWCDFFSKYWNTLFTNISHKSIAVPPVFDLRRPFLLQATNHSFAWDQTRTRFLRSVWNVLPLQEVDEGHTCGRSWLVLAFCSSLIRVDLAKHRKRTHSY